MFAQRIATAFGTAEPIDRATFHVLLSAAVAVALPDAGPVIALVELHDVAIAGQHNGSAQHRVDATAWRLAETLGTQGFVAVLGARRLGILAASDGLHSSHGLEALLHSSLACRGGGEGPNPPATISLAGWPNDGYTADELLVVADGGLYAARSTCAPQTAAGQPDRAAATMIRYRPSPLAIRKP